MGKVLYIKANPKAISRTFRISDSFIEAYSKKNPEDQIITLDLYKDNIRFLTEDDLMSTAYPQKDQSNDHPILRYTYQFFEADKYVIAEPFWNLSMPAILKAYVDYICINGVTFKYTESGPVGLCQGKKAVNIITRGGNYSTSPNEFSDRYLRAIFGFLGITDFTTINADELDVIENDVEAILAQTIGHAQKLAASF